MKNNILIFMKKPFIRNVFILMSGTAMAQIVNMLFSPLITRIYGPEAYGLMGTFTAIIQMFVPIAALSYPIAIVLPKYDYEAKAIIKLSFIVTLFNTILIAVLFFAFGDFIIDVFNLHSISPFLILLPLVVFTAGFLQIIEQWLIRKNLFSISAKSNLVETTLINISKFLAGLLYPSAIILILLTAIRQGFRAILMYISYGKIKIKSILLLSDKEKKYIINQAIKYKDFPLYRAPEVALNAISVNIPVLLLTTFFGPVAAGFYSIAKTVLGVPSILIAKSVGDVFYPRISQAAQEGKKVAPLVQKTTFYLILIGIIPYGLVILLGPELFSLVFGQEWVLAGEYARWVSLWGFLTFINKPSVQTLPVISAQRFQLFFTIGKLIVTTLSLILGFYIFNNDIIAIALFGISGGLSYLVLIIITILKSKKFDESNSRI